MRSRSLPAGRCRCVHRQEERSRASTMFKLRRYFRMDNIPREQHETQKAAEEKSRHARDTLERRVKERTSHLETLNAALQAEIAEHKRAELALLEAKRAAEEASSAKSEFLASM